MIAPEILTALGSAQPAFMHFDDEVVGKWLDDAAPFIEEGRLLYIPQPMNMSYQGRTVVRPRFEVDMSAGTVTLVDQAKDIKGDVAWSFDSADDSFLQSTWRTVAEARKEGASTLIVDSAQKAVEDGFLVVLNAAMPYIDEIPLRTLHKILSDEEDNLIGFRKAISGLLPTYLNETRGMEDPEELIKIGLNIRRDVLDPELAILNKAFDKIIKIRTLRVAGAIVATAGFGIAALSGAGLPGLFGVVSSGSFAGAAKEAIDFREALLTLEEKPWYFAWRLKRRRKLG